MSDESSFLTGLDILGGMPSRQAGTILFAIEGRTAQLVSQSRQALASYLTEKTIAEKEQAFLSAIAQGRDLPLQPSIQDIERFAPEWASLAPSDNRQCAALAKKIADKYHLRRKDVPALRKALRLDTVEVGQAFEQLFQKPIESIYVSKVSVSEQFHWLTSRLANSLERLPPFWTAFSLTLTETVGGSVLALPIALAGVGPIPGVILLIVLGLVNLLTVMGIVEAITRNGPMRYGTTYFGRLVGDYLGKPGSVILIPTLFITNVVGLIAFYIGISTTLADVTGISPLLWCALIFLVAVYYLRRESLSATVASALVIGIVNILIIIILSLLSFPHIEIEHLQYTNIPFVNGQRFDPKIFELIFGVVLAAYFGHTSAGNAAKVVLRRDPGGNSLIFGNIAAMMTVVALYSLWIFAVNGTITHIELSNATGTALSLLAGRVGGIVPILGVVYIILALGIGSVHTSFGLYFQVRELLPSKVKKNILLIVSLTPILILFIFTEWILFTNKGSFSGLIGIMGLLMTPILGGIFPILMLTASRRKGDYMPKRSFGFLGAVPVLILVYLIYLGGVFFYGLFIWDDPFQRIVAVGMGFVILIVTFLVFKQGAFVSRAVLELRFDTSDNTETATLAVVDKGKLVSSNLRVIYANTEKNICGFQVEIPSCKEVKNIIVEFPPLSSKELKIWIHRVTLEGNSEPVSASVNIKTDNDEEVVQLDMALGQIIKPISPHISKLEISLY